MSSRRWKFAVTLVMMTGGFGEASGQAPRITRATAGKRVCEYSSHRIAGRAKDYALVPRGQPCPSSPPGLPARPQPVPSLATLTTQRQQAGALICVYSFGGRNYEVNTGSRLTCPLTPNLF